MCVSMFGRVWKRMWQTLECIESVLVKCNQLHVNQCKYQLFHLFLLQKNYFFSVADFFFMCFCCCCIFTLNIFVWSRLNYYNVHKEYIGHFSSNHNREYIELNQYLNITISFSITKKKHSHTENKEEKKRANPVIQICIKRSNDWFLTKFER